MLNDAEKRGGPKSSGTDLQASHNKMPQALSKAFFRKRFCHKVCLLHFGRTDEAEVADEAGGFPPSHPITASAIPLQHAARPPSISMLLQSCMRSP